MMDARRNAGKNVSFIAANTTDLQQNGSIGRRGYVWRYEGSSRQRHLTLKHQQRRVWQELLQTWQKRPLLRLHGPEDRCPFVSGHTRLCFPLYPRLLGWPGQPGGWKGGLLRLTLRISALFRTQRNHELTMGETQENNKRLNHEAEYSGEGGLVSCIVAKEDWQRNWP
jgi:hypothetical protein